MPPLASEAARNRGNNYKPTGLVIVIVGASDKKGRHAGMQTEADDDDEPTWLVVVR